MVFQWMALFVGHIHHDHVQTLIIVSAIVTCIYMLSGAIDTAVSNAQIKAAFTKGLGNGPTRAPTTTGHQ